MKCAICDTPIPPARTEVSPNTITCSKTCSLENTHRLQRKAKLAYYARRKAARETVVA